jgi:DnaJ-class molecular chaperone
MHESKTGWDYVDPKDPKGYYAYFSVSPSATLSDITVAYIKVIRECAGNEFVLNEARIAYTVLSNPQKRREYDASHNTTTAQNSVREEDASGIQISEPSSPNTYSGRTMGMPAEGNYTPSPQGIRHDTQQSAGCSGCFNLFGIFFLISAILALFKLIFS